MCVKIFGSCLVKNEADIIEETLEHAVTWCDHIIVDDNGSEDETWSIVQRMAAKYPQIIAWRSKAQPYGNKLRGEPFRAFRHRSNQGDWWTRLDSDERYIDDPRQFLAAVPVLHHVVVAAQFQYYFTDEDVDAWDAVESEEPLQPAHKRLHYYRCEHAETRFFRYRPQLQWPENASWPTHMGVVHPTPIRNRHLQYRSPDQMRLRWEVRRKAIAEGCGSFSHMQRLDDWREWIVPSDTCLDDRDANPWQIDYAKLPRFTEKPVHRLVKHFMHGSGLWA
jgi:glycosyltransferase involved in cell wall biosynthesis